MTEPVQDPSFASSPEGLSRALNLLVDPSLGNSSALPDHLPDNGLGEAEVLSMLAPAVLGGARRLDAPEAMAHMDPPTPWITWATALWNASLNQNLLHPDVSPIAGEVEVRVVDWLAPYFGMTGGHMTPGSTVANLTALWAARELAGVRRVVASTAAHLSIAKAAHLLGLEYLGIEAGPDGALDGPALPDSLSDAALVLTAGATSTGAIDDIRLAGRAAWTHVDAAWAGPMRLSTVHAERLAGIEAADSVAVSAHKWLFQPKESGLIFFRDADRVNPAISFGGAYLTQPNVGLLGSHGATAVPLLATLLAWGRTGLASRIDRCMALADDLHDRMSADKRFHLFGPNKSGVLLWRPVGAGPLDRLSAALPTGMSSRTTIGDVDWFRQVAANPTADIDMIWRSITRAI